MFKLNLIKQIKKSSGKTKDVLKAILKDGVYTEEGFWSDEKLKSYNAILKQTYLNKTKDQYSAELNTYLGSKRYYHIERDIDLINHDFKENPLLLDVAKKFNGVLPPNRKTMYQHSTEEFDTKDYYDHDIKDVGQLTPIAPKFHFDFMRRTVKAVVYLNDIEKENGATEFCLKGSYLDKTKILLSKLKKREKYIQNYFLQKNSDADSIWSHDEADKLKLSQLSQPLEGKAGTLAIFDTYLLHRASFLSKGERKILWYYFNF